MFSIGFSYISLFNFNKDKQNNARILIFLKLFLSEESSAYKDPYKDPGVYQCSEYIEFAGSGLAMQVSGC
jgi:hypothetical protein